MKKLIISLVMVVFTLPLFAQATVSIAQLDNVVPGAGLAVAVNADFTGVNNGVSAFQLDITFDNACLTLTGLQNSAYNGIQYALQNSNTVRVIWNDYAAHSYLNGRMFDLVFTYNGGNSNLGFNGATSSVTGFGAIPVTTDFLAGWVNQIPATPGLIIADVAGASGQTIDVALTANEFYNVAGFTLIINFADPSVVTGGSVSLANINSNITSGMQYSYAAGVLSIIWAKPTGGTNVSVAAGTKLFDLRFTYAGGSSDIDFNTASCSINPNVYPYNPFAGVTYTNGSIIGYNAQIKVFLEGLYNSGTGQLNKAHDYVGGVIVDKYSGTIADLVTVELHASNNYSTIVYTAADAILNTDGQVEVNIPVEYSASYYNTIKHRNHIETVSNTATSFASRPMSYDFTTAANKAYGSNMILLSDGKYGFYAGDVNQDGSVNGTDRSLIQSNVLALTQGYVAEDINGDGSVNGTDRSMVQSAVLLLIEKINP